ncbi:MAG: SLBB domain-containing protein [Clostridia bacterium]|nr:SLBB domain-containing protein [Clostridia bacterium]
MQFAELNGLMKECGIVGAGGAGFPSYAKLSEKAETIILNCAECEPLFRLHRQLLSAYAKEILTALDAVRESVGAKNAIVGIKAAYSETVEELNEHIGAFKNIEISLLPEVYPAGDEIVLIYETTGKVVKPGQLPISEGVIVYNVETMLNIHFAITEKKPVCYKYVTVAGEVKTPMTYKVPLGVPLKKVVELSGGETVKDCVYLSGGAMTGKVASKNDVVTKTTNAVLVLPKNHPVIMKKKTNSKVNIYRAMSACCQCRMCTDMCSRNLLGHPIEPHLFMRAAAKGMTKDITAMMNSMYCSQCGICSMYACHQGLSPSMLIGEFRDEIRKRGIKPLEEPKFSGVNEHRKYRTLPMERLVSRLGISKYDVEAPLDDSPQDFSKSLKSLKIMLRQHIGQPAKPVVSVGTSVKAFEKLASCEGLGAEIHSPVDGVIKEITENYILLDIKR